jgi:hypothetical protein
MHEGVIQIAQTEFPISYNQRHTNIIYCVVHAFEQLFDTHIIRLVVRFMFRLCLVHNTRFSLRRRGVARFVTAAVVKRGEKIDDGEGS